ncbi:MAG: Glutamate-semialdehyde -aminomutase [Myxococcaceae bacterium]|nr:Glutamate-semialdehyde -aminomutase [Myxococcaceae bacterium]
MPSSRSAAVSEKLFARAQAVLPGGVSSPVRAFKHVGGAPVFVSKGSGARIVDEDQHEYLDFCLGWGPLILGHAHPQVVDAVCKAARDGLTFGTCHRHEAQLAERVLEAFPAHQMVRFVVSGTEAVMTAVRLARAATRRPLLLKFSGCYHGHVDALMVKAGSGVVTQGLAESEGVTPTVAHDTVVIELGDPAALEAAFKTYGTQIAAVILEPLPANNGLLQQKVEWLRSLREITQKHGALLIFDEVITGFRFGFHGYGKVVEITPDLTTLGKVVGGGLPVGAVVGSKALLEKLAPMGGVYQAGTMAGNPVALAAGLATLEILRTGAPYQALEKLGQAFDAAVAKLPKGPRWRRVGSLVWPYFDPAGEIPTTAEAISKTAIEKFRAPYRGWLEQGVYFPPSAYEVGFFSAAHQPKDVERLAEVLAGG